MVKKNFVRNCLVALAMLVFMPALTHAQEVAGGIAGVVRDETGAVLPGATVEASSPALIEGVRTVVTNGRGRYSIIQLDPGVYVVTFSLSGFRTVQREGIQLSTGFTATVNAEMAVGGVAESVTVTGASPVVDVQNTVQQEVFTEEVIDVIPTGRLSSSFAQLVPGMRATEDGNVFQDVGGILGEGSRLIIHGSRDRDTQWLMNGLPFNRNLPDTSSVRPDITTVDEINFSYSANVAEYQRGGVVMNLITKSGANTFDGSFFTNYAGSEMQSNNLDADLMARGLESVNSLDSIWDVATDLGGPIVQDKLWFYGTLRHHGNDSVIAGIFHDSNLRDFLYTPDLNRPAHDRVWTFNQGLRLTWQAAQQHKLAVYFNNQPRTSFSTPAAQSGTRLTAPEASRIQEVKRNQYAQLTYTFLPSNQLLIDAGTSIYKDRINIVPLEGVPTDTYGILDVGLNLAFNAPLLRNVLIGANVQAHRAALSYVTGSHNFKVGFTLETSEDPQDVLFNDPVPVNQFHLNGSPILLLQHRLPRFSANKLNAALGIFAQDQWTIDLLTINAGLRFDYHNASVPAQVQPGGLFLPESVAYAEVTDVPNWKDVYPRLGVAYDLSGTGKTVVKASFNRYPLAAYQGIASRNNPANATANTTTRTWSDSNNDFFPDCDLASPDANGECGAFSNRNFGTSTITRFYDPDYLTGSGKRANNYVVSVGLQHELVPQVAVEAAYFRRWYTNFTTTDNRQVTPGDFNPFCITSPVDSRLPGGGGQEVCGQWDVTPEKFGLSDDFTTFTKNFGEQTEVYDGVDLGINARLTNGLILQGGLNTGRTRTDSCVVVDSPQALHFCDVKPPFQTELSFLGTYTLPRLGVDISGSLQSAPGPQITATYVARNEQIAPSLGRDLSAGANGTATVALIEPGTLYDDRFFQVDLRASKVVEVGRMRVRAMVDLYNVFNANTILGMNTGFGAFWLRPTIVVPGRLLKFGLQLDY